MNKKYEESDEEELDFEEEGLEVVAGNIESKDNNNENDKNIKGWNDDKVIDFKKLNEEENNEIENEETTKNPVVNNSHLFANNTGKKTFITCLNNKEEEKKTDTNRGVINFVNSDLTEVEKKRIAHEKFVEEQYKKNEKRDTRFDEDKFGKNKLEENKNTSTSFNNFMKKDGELNSYQKMKLKNKEEEENKEKITATKKDILAKW